MVMDGTALYMAPMARKKKVGSHYAPNSYRVISHQAESIPEVRPEVTAKITSPSNLLGQPTVFQPKLPNLDPEHRYHNPNPRNVNFLRQDVHLLNEPVCNVSTNSTKEEQHKWWPHRTSNEPLHQPPKPLDTTVRKDFQYRGIDVEPCGRFSAAASCPGKKVAHGIVPVTSIREPDNKPRFWSEGLSYEHQYNSRLDPQYSLRGKRHGSFVWSRMQPSEVEELMRRQSKGCPDKEPVSQMKEVLNQVTD